MTKYFILYLLLITGLFFSCGSYDDGYYYECSSQDVELLLTTYGKRILDYDNSNLVPSFNEGNEIKFKDSLGNEFTCFRSATVKEIVDQKVWRKEEIIPCQFSIEKYKLGRLEKVSLLYHTSGWPIPTVTVQRYWDLVYQTDSLGYWNMSENFTIGFEKGYLFRPNLNYYGDTIGQQFHLTLKAGNGENHDSVFELYNPASDPRIIVPQGLYYTRAKGIIGFYLTNKVQQWWLE